MNTESSRNLSQLLPSMIQPTWWCRMMTLFSETLNIACEANSNLLFARSMWEWNKRKCTQASIWNTQLQECPDKPFSSVKIVRVPLNSRHIMRSFRHDLDHPDFAKVLKKRGNHRWQVFRLRYFVVIHNPEIIAYTLCWKVLWQHLANFGLSRKNHKQQMSLLHGSLSGIRWLNFTVVSHNISNRWSW